MRAGGVLDRLHDDRQFAPRRCRHGLHDGRRKNAAYTVDRVVLDVSSADGEIEDFAGAHKNALERCLMACCLDAFDCVNDKRRGNFVNLPATDWPDDVSLQPTLFVCVRDDPASFEVAPKFEGVCEHIASRVLKSERFSSLSSFLTSLLKCHFRPSPKSDVGNASCIRQAQVPAFNARRVDPQAKAVAVRHGESFFFWQDCRYFL